MYKGKIYFDKTAIINGKRVECKSLLSYVGTWINEEELITEDNLIFEATLHYLNYSKGRSSIEMIFVNADNTYQASMFISDFHRLLILGANPNKVKGKWCYTKKGANYGLQLVEIIE